QRHGGLAPARPHYCNAHRIAGLDAVRAERPRFAKRHFPERPPCQTRGITEWRQDHRRHDDPAVRPARRDRPRIPAADTPADLAQGIVAAERIRTSIEEYKFSVVRQGRTEENHHITVSIGVSCFPNDSHDPIELVEMADSALYRAKRQGRDRVAAYRDVTPEELNSADLPPPRD